MDQPQHLSGTQDALELIRRRLQELQAEQRQLELRYQMNARVIAELETLLRRAEEPPPEPVHAAQAAPQRVGQAPDQQAA